VHVFVVQIDQIAKRTNVARRAWFGRSVVVDVALGEFLGRTFRRYLA
jgi:hypothetical protein